MKKKLIFKKGYILEVESWENDGDDYATRKMHFETKEEAIAVNNMCKEIFISGSNDEGGIGNFMEDEVVKGELIIIEYLINNPKLLKLKNLKTIKSMREDILKEFKGEATKENYKEYAFDYYEKYRTKEFKSWIDLVMNYNSNLLGASEWYYSRVYDESSLFYTPEDLYLEEVS